MIYQLIRILDPCGTRDYKFGIFFIHAFAFGISAWAYVAKVT